MNKSNTDYGILKNTLTKIHKKYGNNYEMLLKDIKKRTK